MPLARHLARTDNEYAARAISDHPGRFGMFASLPLPDVEGSLVDVAYALDVLKADGIHMWTNYGDFWLGDARLRPLREELQIWDRHFPHDRQPCVLGRGSQYPDIRWIFSHGGGTMPFLIERYLLQGRLMKNNPEVMERIPNGVMYELQRMRFETAQVANPYALEPLIRRVPKTQLFFGTDYPYRDIADNIQGLADCGLLSPTELLDIERLA